MRTFTYAQLEGYLAAAKTQMFRNNISLASLHRTVAAIAGGKATDIGDFLPAFARPNMTTGGTWKWPPTFRADIRYAFKNKLIPPIAWCELDNDELARTIDEPAN